MKSQPSCPICQSGKRLTVAEWNKCPVQLAEWNATTNGLFLPRSITYWFYFRNNPQHIKEARLNEQRD